MEKKLIIGVMGGGVGEEETLKAAYRLGKLIAENNWILLNGGRNAGVMDASAKGAAENGGLTIGVLPDSGPGNVSEFIQVPIYTDMGNGRNNINVLSSDIVVACKGGAGTLSEIALALKNKKHVICMNFDIGSSFDKYDTFIHHVNSPEETVGIIRQLSSS